MLECPIPGEKEVFLVENIIRKNIPVEDTKQIIHCVRICYTEDDVTGDGWYIQRVSKLHSTQSTASTPRSTESPLSVAQPPSSVPTYQEPPEDLLRHFLPMVKQKHGSAYPNFDSNSQPLGRCTAREGNNLQVWYYSIDLQTSSFKS
jgi:hypothetical protein